MTLVTRREFVRTAAIATAATHLVSSLCAAESPKSAVAPSIGSQPLPEGLAQLKWLEAPMPAALPGVTLGLPWPRGKHAKGTSFALRTAAGQALPLQSWALATWPDGSLKWTGHALPADAPVVEAYEIAPGTPIAAAKALAANETADCIEIDTGVIRCRIAKKGPVLIETISRAGRETAKAGRLVCLRQDSPDVAAGAAAAREEFVGNIASVTLEQNGPVRAVVKIEGKHAGAGGRTWLPFVVRIYFYAGGEALRVMHTIVFDGDEKKDFIAGLGLRFGVPMSDALYDRHIRFAGEETGLWAEAVKGITGLRRDPGSAVRTAQFEGRACPPLDTWGKAVIKGLPYIPVWNDYTLSQSSADGFEIRKRTKPGYTWLKAGCGRRAGGTGYVGGPSGGVTFGLRNFWQSYPAQLDIRGAGGDEAEVTLWLWAPDAAPMDLRGYHDGLGEDTYFKQNAAMDITYEDHEPGFDKPEGVARTSEMFLWVQSSTPTRGRLAELAEAVRMPPVLVPRPEYLHACNVFGGLWAPVDRSTPAKATLEDQLDWYFKYYVTQREERHWYGFWNYGDVMHTYDTDRHTWRYDIGGFAWDNSELSTDLWLWLFFLRTGRADVFRFAEAMTRHTGEVDVHHLGRFAPLGSRHNVLHWGCSAKQLRISTAMNRRYYYYLTADERVGDLMHEQVEAVRALVNLQPGRKIPFVNKEGGSFPAEKPADTDYTNVGFGTDWGSISGAWLTEWERTGDVRVRDRLVASMRSIAKQPRGFFSSGGRMNLSSGTFDISPNPRASVSHLSAVFGLPEACAELIQLLDEPEFKRAWLEYCELYNAPSEEQERRLGNKLNGISLTQGHSRLTAYAAKQMSNPALEKRAWGEFFRPENPSGRRPKLETRRITGPAVLTPVDEAPFVSTNGTAQWGLAAIQCLALAGDALPEDAK